MHSPTGRTPREPHAQNFPGTPAHSIEQLAAGQKPARPNAHLAPRKKRIKYRFTGRTGDRYYWQAGIPGDSRVLQISCNVEWFWGRNST